MSKGYSGYFNGTSGANTLDEDSVVGNSSKISKSEKTYSATASLMNHIENPEPTTSGKSGIKGAHHKENFLAAVNKVGAKATGSVPNSQINGVERISYQMPKRDRYGKPTNEYQQKVHHKTVYDASKISTKQYISRGLQAANQAVKNSAGGKLSREWTGKDNHGVLWRGYCDSNGNITSFYPED